MEDGGGEAAPCSEKLVLRERNGEIQPADHQPSTTSAPPSSLCGYNACCTPPCLQPLRSAKALVLCLSLLAAALGATVNGLVPVAVTTLERRFDLSSADAGLFAGAYKLASMSVLLPVAHAGATGHKGRYLGTGAVCIGAGSLLVAGTHFAAERLEPRRTAYGMDGAIGSGGGQQLCSANTTVEFGGDGEAAESERRPVSRWFYWMLVLGQLLHGMGGSTVVLLAITFLDENVTSRASPVYNGIFIASRNIVGPAMGYLLGGAALKLPADLLHKGRDRAGHPSEHYGAWWLGFAVAGLCSLAVAPALLAFPRRLPEAAANRMKDARHGALLPADAAEEGAEHLGGGVAGLLKAILSLTRRGACLPLVLAQSCEAFIMVALLTFSPKYIEQTFALDASTASLVSGGILIGGGLAGTLAGGLLARSLRLKCRGMIAVALIVAALCVPLQAVFLIGCDRPALAGHQTPHAYAGCAAGCACAGGNYEPVCEPGERTYFYSACQAGCAVAASQSGTFTNCTCATDARAHLRAGMCAADCEAGVRWFALLYALFVFVAFVGNVPAQQAVMRAVPFASRTVSLGMHLLADGLGTILGAVCMGAVFDATCAVAADAGGGARRSCLLYHTGTLAWVIIAFGVTSKGLCVVFFAIALRLHSRRVRKEDGGIDVAVAAENG